MVATDCDRRDHVRLGSGETSGPLVDVLGHQLQIGVTRRPLLAIFRRTVTVDTSSDDERVAIGQPMRSSPHSYSSAATERAGTSVSRRKTATAEFTTETERTL
jgi:hypothetical protein